MSRAEKPSMKQALSKPAILIALFKVRRTISNRRTAQLFIHGSWPKVKQSRSGNVSFIFHRLEVKLLAVVLNSFFQSHITTINDFAKAILGASYCSSKV